MKGSFRITGVKDRASLGFGVTGLVISGALIAGMEDDSREMTIQEIRSISDDREIEKAIKGMRCIIVLSNQRPMTNLADGQVLEFHDTASLLLKKPLVLTPDPM